MLRTGPAFLVSFLLALACSIGAAGQSATSDPLLDLLVQKGVISALDARAVAQSPAGERLALARLLRDKGVLSEAEFQSLQPPPGITAATSAPLVATKPAALAPAPPAAPQVIAAVAPLRVLPIEPVKPDGMVPDLKLGSGARLKVYGMLKASVVHDSSSPLGTDMPLPAFILNDTGPGGAPEFHIKARAARVGVNFEAPDLSKKLAITGRLEYDFEGNFTRVWNRNISSIRSSEASLRLAWVRLDYNVSRKNDWFVVMGQDWTPFGSSTLPGLFETTGFGLGYGTLSERAPEARLGLIRNVGGSRGLKISPEIALVLPASGDTPGDLSQQLGMGEREGPDSNRPEIEGRVVAQWQLDKTAGVAPAQVIASFVQGKRTAIFRAADVPLAFRTTFPNGVDLSSDRYGWTGEVQLPTRWFTLLAKYWNGADLRFFFVGQLYSFYNDIGVFQSGAPVTGASADGSATAWFGYCGPASTDPCVAPQRPMRAQGGFLDLGLPLSRLAHADPAGRNAGWTLNFHYAYDQALARDVRKLWAATVPASQFASTRGRTDLGAVTLNYKVNQFLTFTYEDSYYRTRTVRGVTLPLFEGRPVSDWHDLREEFGTTFTF